jgi:hypothetical protein
MLRYLLAITAFLACAAPWTARADEDKREPVGQEYFAVGPQLSFIQPNGLVLHAGLPEFALELSGGFVPLLLSYTTPDDDLHIRLLAKLEADADVVVRVAHFKRTMSINVRGGYRYNELLGNGGGVGASFAKRFNRLLALDAGIGLSLFLDAEKRLREKEVPVGTRFGALPPSIGWGVSARLLIYP